MQTFSNCKFLKRPFMKDHKQDICDNKENVFLNFHLLKIPLTLYSTEKFYSEKDKMIDRHRNLQTNLL